MDEVVVIIVSFLTNNDKILSPAMGISLLSTITIIWLVILIKRNENKRRLWVGFTGKGSVLIGLLSILISILVVPLFFSILESTIGLADGAGYLGIIFGMALGMMPATLLGIRPSLIASLAPALVNFQLWQLSLATSFDQYLPVTMLLWATAAILSVGTKHYVATGRLAR